MDPEYLVVLYSKYSPQCKKILQVYDENTMDYIKLVCVDNSKFRSRLALSKSLDIKTVPCVLFIYPGNKVEKFEGSNVTKWILDQISNNLPSSAERKTILETTEPYVQPEPLPVQQQPLPVQQQPLPVQQQPLPVQQQQQQQQPQKTSIDDLFGEPTAQDEYFMHPPQQAAAVAATLESIRPGQSIAEKAAAMAAQREQDIDKPAHIKMREMQQQGLQQGMQGGIGLM